MHSFKITCSLFLLFLLHLAVSQSSLSATAYRYKAPPPPIYDWQPLGVGINGPIRPLAADSQGNIYAGGTFAGPSSNPSQSIVRWDGSSWSGLGTGINGSVYIIAVDSNDELIVGGAFASAGGKSVNYLAKWDGTDWYEMPGMNAQVWDLKFDNNGILYAAGSFKVAGGITVNYICWWDGCRWHPLGTGLNAEARSIAFDSSNNLYAAGSFTTAGGVVVNRVAKWDGTSWSALATGSPQEVMTVLVDSQDDIIIGGRFGSVSGVPANRIARWNGSTWSAMGNGFRAQVEDLSMDNQGNIYAAGSFAWHNGDIFNHIAKWDGTRWSALGDGTNNIIRSVLAVDNEVYVGGQFSEAGGLTANNVAVYRPIAPAAAIHLDGIDDKITVAHHDSINYGTNQDFSIECWIKVPATAQVDLSATGNVIVEKWNGTASGYPYAIRFLNQNNAYAGRIRVGRFDGTYAPSLTSTSTVNDETWHHVAFVKEGNTLYLYIDGILETSGTDSTVGSTQNTSNLTIGARGGAGSVFFKGYVDELRFWSRPLCDQEITLHSDCELSPTFKPALQAYFTFNNNYGTESGDSIVANLAQSSFPGTLNNLALTGPTSNWVLAGALPYDVLCTVPDTCQQNIPRQSFNSPFEEQKLSLPHPGEIKNSSSSLGQSVGLAVFPNPSSDRLQIQFSETVLPIQKVMIYGPHGQIVWHSNQLIENSLLEIPLTGRQFPSGAYWIQAAGKDQTLTVRFVKQ